MSCRNSVVVSDNEQYHIDFLDEYVFTQDSVFAGSVIGGLSGIEYDQKEDLFYIICDDSKNPRFYKATIAIKNNLLTKVVFQPPSDITNYQEQMPDAAVLDPESIRKLGNNLLIASEGTIRYGYHPSLFVSDTSGTFQYAFELPSYFLADSLSLNQPRHNAVFEGIAVDIDNTGFWAATELPLANDGSESNYEETGAPARITHFNTISRKATTQFTYPLDKLSKDPKGMFGVNGITALLQIDTHHFLILERGYVAGYGTQGNTVRIYLADISNATNTLNIPVTKDTKIVSATKTLLFDFETVRHQLTDGIVDNMEGITFGPLLNNGNPSLILVSDNNFNPPGEQLNQFILLELKKE